MTTSTDTPSTPATTRSPSPSNTTLPKAIQFGAGNIGRGFIGALLTSSGYHVVFADVNPPVINAINEASEYHIKVLMADGSEEEESSGPEISAVLSSSEDASREVVSAAIITTAVGPDKLRFVGPTVARGLQYRMQAGNEDVVNIIACENRVGASELLKEHVIEALKDDKDTIAWMKDHVGFACCSVDRIVPPAPRPPANDPTARRRSLDVGVEQFHEWIVDKTALIGSPPFPKEVHGMQLTDRLHAYEERKLFTLNTGHAMTAYLGFLKGYTRIAESIADDEIYRNVHAAMSESGAALCKRHGFDPMQHAKYIDRVINRFRNPHLKDECARVGREPLRKLGRQDRFVGPASLCKEYGLSNAHLCRAIAAALRYSSQGDKQAIEITQRVKKDGLEKVIEELTGWKEGDSEVESIRWNYDDLKQLEQKA